MVRSLVACDITLDQIKQCITLVTDRGVNIKKAFDSFVCLPCSCHILNATLYHAFRLQPVVNQQNAKNNEASIDLLEEDYDTQMESVTKLLNTTK